MLPDVPKDIDYKAISYRRLSKMKKDKSGRVDPTHTAQTLDNQRQINDRLSTQYGIPIVREYEDEDESASKFRRKKEKPPGWAQALRDLKTGVANVVFVSAWDRGSREGLASVVEIADALPKDGRFITGNHGEINLKDAHGRISAAVISELAAGYSEAISEKAKIGIEARALAGKPQGGGYPRYGHDRAGAIIPEEAAVIRQIYRWITEEGLSGTGATRRLNELGIPAKMGGPWGNASVTHIMKSPRLYGIVIVETEDGGKQPIPTYEPILSEEEWVHLQTFLVLTRAQQRATKNEEEEILLSPGLLRCGNCEQNMGFFHQNLRGKRLSRYRCAPHYVGVSKEQQYGCNQSIDAEFAHAFVIAQVAAAHGTALDPLQHSPDASVETMKGDLKAEINDFEKREVELRRLFRSGSYPADDFAADRHEILTTIETAKRKLAMLEDQAPKNVGPKAHEDAAEWFANASPEDKRTALRSSLLSVLCYPGVGRKMVDRLDPQWRFGRMMAIGQAAEKTLTPFDEKAVADESYQQLVEEVGGTLTR